MILLRAFLLAGLVVHKIVWEALKRRKHPGGKPSPEKRPAGLALVKAAKIGILVGIVVQTLSPELFPITAEPFALRVVGTVIYSIGLAVALAGRIQLGDNWADIETARIVENQDLVAAGLYRYIRHPIYVGDLMLLFGLELALNSWLVVAVVALVPVVLWKALREEKMLVRTLPGYDKYCARTKRFVPFTV